MASESIEIHPVSGALGAEISGVDLAEPLDEAELEKIRRALLDRPE